MALIVADKERRLAARNDASASAADASDFASASSPGCVVEEDEEEDEDDEGEEEDKKPSSAQGAGHDHDLTWWHGAKEGATTLIICPKAVLDQWIEEAGKHIRPGFIRCTKFHGKVSRRP